ncbi:DUF3348 family protein [Isoalcanivorax indicus]|uniref:DUF3348 family protein n=1 Tax=Isoalcanivorax indicus TaxID=2202653 RepID=UPI000DBA1C6A|nr:DUF3348 family protein [Isoalcanivorax indicus]
MRTSPDKIAEPDRQLLALLAALGASDKALLPTDVAARLARLLSISDAAALDAAARRPLSGPFHLDPALPDLLREDLLRTREGVLAPLARSLAGDAENSPIIAPRPPEGLAADQRPPFRPWEAFYLAWQRRIAAAIGDLRRRVRQALVTGSPALARMAHLDAALEQSLGGYSQRGFNTVPLLLEKAYRARWQARDPDDDTGAWLTAFHHTLQACLLAEMDARLAPVLGMLDALDSKDMNTP